MTKKLAEANFQTRMIKDLRAGGWKVYKLQSGMGYTILDVFATHPYWGPVWIECKTIPNIRTKIDLTPLQRKEIKELNAANCLAVVAIGVNVGRDQEMYITPKEEITHVGGDTAFLRRLHGEKWDSDLFGRKINGIRYETLKQGE